MITYEGKFTKEEVKKHIDGAVISSCLKGEKPKGLRVSRPIADMLEGNIKRYKVKDIVDSDDMFWELIF